LICVIVTASGSDVFYPMTESEVSLSFLPVAIGKNMLSNAVSVFNTFFSRDKIYIVCSIAQYEFVLNTNTGISEENIIVEPESVNYSVSIFYASKILAKIIQDEVLFFFRADRFFLPETKISEWITTCEVVSSGGKLLFPLKVLGKEYNDDHWTDPVVEAGKITNSDKKNEVYGIERINIPENSIKRRKLFGKQGKMLYIVTGTVQALHSSFSLCNNSFLNELGSVLSAFKLTWADIIALYKKRAIDGLNVSIFNNGENNLCMFVDSFTDRITSWGDLLSLVSVKSNYITGNVTDTECSDCVILNFDEEAITIEKMQRTLLIKKSGLIYCKGF